MSNKSVKVGVVGLGYWGPNLVRNFVLTNGGEVTWVCDTVPQRCERMKKLYPWLKTTNSYEEMLRAVDIDAVAIATPVATHYELAKKALEGGKHVLIEKPMCVSVAEAEELITTAGKLGRTLMVEHTFLYTSSVRKIKELVCAKELGNLYYFDSVRINLGLFRSDVDVIWDLAPHDISILLYLLGKEPVRVSAIAKDFTKTKNSLASIAYIILEFNDDFIAHIHVSWLSPVKVRQIIIGGSRKMIVYDDIEPSEKIKVYDRGIEFDPTKENPLQTTYRLGDVYIPSLQQQEALWREAEHFIDCILHHKKPLTDGEFGCQVVKILEACSRSLKEGGI